MSRKSVPVSGDHPYHVTARCHNRDPFPLRLDSVWAIMEDYLYLAHHGFGLAIHSFVLMPNHFHLLASAPRANLSETLLYFMRETSREIGRLSKTINQIYGGRNHKSLIRSHHYFLNAYKYVYRNPVRAGLSDRAENYRYSTLNGVIGQSRLLIPIVEDTLLFTPRFDPHQLNWLNTPPMTSAEDEVRRALKRSEFKFGICRRTGRPSTLEEHLL